MRSLKLVFGTLLVLVGLLGLVTELHKLSRGIRENSFAGLGFSIFFVVNGLVMFRSARRDRVPPSASSPPR